jgi:hypothetical protein
MARRPTTTARAPVWHASVASRVGRAPHGHDIGGGARDQRARRETMERRRDAAARAQ